MHAVEEGDSQALFLVHPSQPSSREIEMKKIILGVTCKMGWSFLPTEF